MSAASNRLRRSSDKRSAAGSGLAKRPAKPFDADTIVLLSDGNPFKCTWQGENFSEHEQILWRVRQANEKRGARIHTVALLTGARRADKQEDSQAAAEFLRRLAGAHRGEFREIR